MITCNCWWTRAFILWTEKIRKYSEPELYRTLVITRNWQTDLLREWAEQVSAYTEDSLLAFWCENQVEALTIGEGPVKHQQHLLLWVALLEGGTMWKSWQIQLCVVDGRKLWVFELTLATTGNTGAATVLQYVRWIPDEELEVVFVRKFRKRTMNTLQCYVKEKLAFCMTVWIFPISRMWSFYLFYLNTLASPVQTASQGWNQTLLLWSVSRTRCSPCPAACRASLPWHLCRRCNQRCPAWPMSGPAAGCHRGDLGGERSQSI